MQDVLQEIEDGVIILEEEDEEGDSFNSVEFANSFMQQLFKSNFKADSPENVVKIKQLSKEPIQVKTAEEILNQKDMEDFNSADTTNLEKLIFASEESFRKPTDSFLMIKAPSIGVENLEDKDEDGKLDKDGERKEEKDKDADSSRQKLKKKGSQPQKDNSSLFIVQTSMRKLVFNDKECRILILKNMTSAFRFKKASEMGQNMKMLTTTVSHEMRLPLESVITMCKILLSWTNDKRMIEVIKTIQGANKIILCRVGDLLDLSTLDKGSFNANLKVFDLPQSIEEIVSINRAQALFKDIKVQVMQQNQVPNYIRTDHGRMQ